VVVEAVVAHLGEKHEKEEEGKKRRSGHGEEIRRGPTGCFSLHVLELITDV
jgi:hypothetical protein